MRERELGHAPKRLQGERVMGKAAAIAMGAMWLLGCASGPVPVAQMARTQAAIRTADEVGADKLPRAAYHLQLAKEESEHAREVIAKGERRQAASLLDRAEADANLSVALARENQQKLDAQAAVSRVHDLRQQAGINR
jgi:hypothetical protein